MKRSELRKYLRSRLARLRVRLERVQNRARFGPDAGDPLAARHAGRTEAALIGSIDELELILEKLSPD